MKSAVVLAIAACSRRDPIASCDDDLHGVYAAGDERWMMLDNGAALEAYPLFPDGGGPEPAGSMLAEVVAAPRVIDFARAPAKHASLAGTLRRRYMRRAERCEAHVPVHITRCAGDTLELVLADPSPPLAYAPCTWSLPGPSRVVRWRRE